MHRHSTTHPGRRAARRRRNGLFTLAATAGLVALLGGQATMAAAGEKSSAPVVRAGAKSIERSAKSNSSGLVSVHSSQATGVVEQTPVVYLVFWGKQWSNDPAGASSALTSLFGTLHGTVDTWGTIMTQYCENVPSGTVTCGTNGTHVTHPTSSLLGSQNQNVWFDNVGFAPAKATSSQIAAEAVAAATHFGNTSPGSNVNAQYVIASPSGTHPDGFPHGFCAWHSSTTSADGNIAYTNLPYVPDLGPGACTTFSPASQLDGYESTETHEYAETVTDPFPSNGWLRGGAEIGDLCENLDAHVTINNLTYDVQGLWSNAVGKCVTSG